MFQYVRFLFFFSSRRRHTRYWRDWSSDVCSSDLRACASGDSFGQASTRGLYGVCVSRSMRQKSTLCSSLPRRTGQIGRASGRERVKISVVAVSLKKNKASLTVFKDVFPDIYEGEY